MRVEVKKAIIRISVVSVLIFSLIFISSEITFAQNPNGLIVSPNEDYLLGPSDVIDITVEDGKELSGTFRLSAKGTFILPVVGEINAHKKRTDEVAATIVAKIRAAKWLNNPIVQVSLKQSNSRAVFIQGAVNKPGIYQVEGQLSLLKLITIAGGPTEKSGSIAYIMREKKPSVGELTLITDVTGNSKEDSPGVIENIKEGNDTSSLEEEKYEIIKADISNLYSGTLKQSVLINPGDIVHIPQGEIVFIQGAVNKPGTYQVEGQVSLLKLITIAGGLTEKYGSTAYVMREKKSSNKQVTSTNNVNSAVEGENTTGAVGQNKNENYQEDEKYELVKTNINNLLKGNLELNVMINPGDIVHIPPGDIFFVAGEVKAPGSFTLREGTTLRQAISLAQGTKFEGNLDKGIIFREDRISGKRQEISVNIGQIMNGKQNDIDILPNDVIIVPNSRKKTITKGILNGLTGGLPGLLLRGIGL